MKKLMFPVLAALLSTICAAADLEKPIYGDTRPPRQIKIGSGVIFAILPGQTGSAEVVVDKKASGYTMYAAEELSKYLSKITGVQVPVVNTPSNDVKHHFYVGISQASAAAGVDESKLCRDAFYIISKGNDVYIAGRDDANAVPAHDLKNGIWGRMHEKGSLFGVYDFLERFGNCRFYFPGKLGVIVPEKQVIRVPEIYIFDRPDYEFRRVSIFNGTWDGAGKPYLADLSPERSRHYDYLRLQTRIVPNNHGLKFLNYTKRFGQSNPEYFALRSNNVRCNDPTSQFSGQLCYSSKITDEIFLDAKALLTGQTAESRKINPQGKSYWDPSGHQVPGRGKPGIFGFMPQDAYVKCCCKDCRKHFTDLQSSSNFMWGKLLELNERLRKNNIRDYYLSLMAYPPYKEVPQLQLPENILVMLATQGPWDNEIQQQKDLDLIRRWNKKLPHKVWLWNYPGKFGTMQMPGIPDITPRAIGRFYRSLRNDISGAYMNSATDKLIYHALNYYIFAKVAWDNNADSEVLLDDYYQRMYSAAAPFMKQIDSRIEDIWVKQIGGRCVFTELGPVVSPPSESEVYHNIYSPAVLAELTELFDKAEKAAIRGLAIERVRFMRREILDELKKRSDVYLERNHAIADFKHYLAPGGSELKLQSFGPVSRQLKSIVKLQKDDSTLQLIFDCEEPEMANIKAVKRQEGDMEIWRDNGVEVFLDPQGTRQSYYQILLNSVGSVCTRIMDAKTKQGKLCKLNVKVDIQNLADGWRAIVRIPLKELGNWSDTAAVANFVRVRCTGNNQELYSWSPFLQHNFQEVENFGILSFVAPEKINNIAGEGSFEVKRINPYLLGNWVVTGQRVAGNTVALDETIFVDGSQSLCMTAADKKFNGYFAIRYYLPQLKANTRYELSFFMRTENVVPLRAGGGASLNIWDANNLWFPKNWISGTQPWRKMRFEFTTRPGTNGSQKSYMACCLYFATGKVWFDKIVLRELSDNK